MLDEVIEPLACSAETRRVAIPAGWFRGETKGIGMQKSTGYGIGGRVRFGLEIDAVAVDGSGKIIATEKRQLWVYAEMSGSVRVVQGDPPCYAHGGSPDEYEVEVRVDDMAETVAAIVCDLAAESLMPAGTLADLAEAVFAGLEDAVVPNPEEFER